MLESTTAHSAASALSLTLMLCKRLVAGHVPGKQELVRYSGTPVVRATGMIHLRPRTRARWVPAFAVARILAAKPAFSRLQTPVRSRNDASRDTLPRRRP